MGMDWQNIRYFRPEEFADPDYPGSGELIQDKVVALLEWLRRNTGWPVIVHAAVDVDGVHHSRNSFHNQAQGCKAVDFHFKTDADFRHQAQKVIVSGFRGIGIYQDWRNPGFHCDTRDRFQIWKREAGQYVYLLK